MRSSASLSGATRSDSTARSCISSIWASLRAREVVPSWLSVWVVISRRAPTAPASASACRMPRRRGGSRPCSSGLGMYCTTDEVGPRQSTRASSSLVITC